MKTVKYAVLFCLLTLSSLVWAGVEHDHHVKHNMVLFGEKEIFISHIVYKSPHNYQVILKVDFDEATKNLYLDSRKNSPKDDYIFLLDKMHIADIASLDSITGTMFKTDASGVKTILAEGVTVNKARYRIVFFNELPLSLEK